MPESRKKRIERKRSVSHKSNSSASSPRKRASAPSSQSAEELPEQQSEQPAQQLPEQSPESQQPTQAESHPQTQSQQPTPAEPQKPTQDINLEYKTYLDDLYQLVQQEGEISLISLSKKLNLPETRIEEWGRIFDKAGMLELYYPFVGGALLRKKGFVRPGEEKKKTPPTETKIPQNAPNVITTPASTVTAAGINVGLSPEELQAEQKLKPKKTSGALIFGLILVFVALLAVLAYVLIKGGYLKLG